MVCYSRSTCDHWRWLKRSVVKALMQVRTTHHQGNEALSVGHTSIPSTPGAIFSRSPTRPTYREPTCGNPNVGSGWAGFRPYLKGCRRVPVALKLCHTVGYVVNEFRPNHSQTMHQPTMTGIAIVSISASSFSSGSVVGIQGRDASYTARPQVFSTTRLGTC